MALTFAAGLALKMYPVELLKYGATCLSNDGGPVESEQFFLCLKTDATGGLWTPLHVTRGMDRMPIPEESKSGFPDFVRDLSYFSTRELWRIPHKAAQKASSIAGDKSDTKQANRVSGKWMPTPEMFAHE